MLVGEQRQDGVALLLSPAGRSSLMGPFRISRRCRMCVKRSAADWILRVLPRSGQVLSETRRGVARADRW
jgi:hypothetical protein